MKVLLAVYLLFMGIMNGCNINNDVRVYLVPQNYQGPLLLIEDPNAKDSIKISGDTILFDFRKSIVLKMRGKFIEGSYSLTNLKYYYIDSLGNKTEIPITFGNYTKIDSNKVYVYLMSSQISSEPTSQCDLISTPKDLLDNGKKQDKLTDSLCSKRPPNSNK